MYPQFGMNQMYQYQFPNQTVNPAFNQNMQRQSMDGLGGKVVDSIEVVRVTDVPMDGQTYYFPKADGTEIYSKRWLNNGTTQILTFKNDFSSQTGISTQKAEKPEFEQITTDYNRVLQQIKKLEERVESLESTKQKKKVISNESE